MARQDECISCLFLVNMTQVLETVVWSLTLIIPYKYLVSVFNLDKRAVVIVVFRGIMGPERD